MKEERGLSEFKAEFINAVSTYLFTYFWSNGNID